MMASRYAHAKQFKRHHRQLRLLGSRLGRIIRDIRRKIIGRSATSAARSSDGPSSRRSSKRRSRALRRSDRNGSASEVDCIICEGMRIVELPEG
jgi:transposase, IS5 family